MRRRERVLSALKTLTDQRQSIFSHMQMPSGSLGFTTTEIARVAGVTRSNCSGELNALCRSGVVSKLPGRPARYWPASSSNIRGVERPPSLGGAKAHSSWAQSGVPVPQESDPFGNVVGSNRSLLEAVRLAKIAMRYPPSGMHSLLLGEAGVGKSTFARTMHAFAVSNGVLNKGAPFVLFNCAEYANNPEILLDHLFGHVKGAYTGATSDKPGLIEIAHHGVLFLDEIHRLPPQGQEMLFHWLDNGTFRRMGEAETERRAQALLIAATTETDESALLLTFRRRIPVTINLVPLREWSIYDRYELIYRCLHEEAEILGLPIRLTGSAVDRLLFAHLPGNVGGLKNALKLACARAYTFDNDSSELRVDRHHVQVADEQRISLVGIGSIDRVKDIQVTPSETPHASNTSIFEDSLYSHLIRLGEQLQEIGLEHDEIVIAIERELLRRQFSQPMNPSLAELKRFVGDTFYGWMERSWNSVAHRIDPAIAEAAFIRISVHLSGLTRDGEDIESQLDASVVQHVYREYPELCSIAQALLVAFARESAIRLPEQEIALVALLLKPTPEVQNGRVGLVLVMQGDGIATQLAHAARQLEFTARLISLDVPFGAEQVCMTEQVGRAVELADTGHGALVMTDLPYVKHWATLRQGTACLFRPDLTDILQAGLAIQSGWHELDTMVHWVERGQRSQNLVPAETKHQMWTCCMTGRGSAMALKRLIENALPAEWLDQIDIVPVEVGRNGTASATAGSNLVATIGSVRPNVPGVPFLSVEELLAPRGIERLLNIIARMQTLTLPSTLPEARDAGGPASVRSYVESMLEKDLVLVNPKVAMRAAEEAVTLLQRQTGLTFDESWRARFVLHMAYVVERIVRGTPMDHPDAADLQREQPVLWQQMETALTPYETWFQIQLTAEEMAYLLSMIMSSATQETALR